MKQVALRPLRVGITQSNRSIPVATASRMSCGRPTPIKYRGRSLGQEVGRHREGLADLLAALADADSADGVAVEVHGRPAPRRTRRGGRRAVPPGRSRRGPDRRARGPSLQRRAQRDRSGRRRRRSPPSRAGSAGQWSRHMATSAPSSSWIAVGPLGRQLEQAAVEVRAEGHARVGHAAASARLKTWKPPESVRIGPSQPMNGAGRRARPRRPRPAARPGGRCWPAPSGCRSRGSDPGSGP